MGSGNLPLLSFGVLDILDPTLLSKMLRKNAAQSSSRPDEDRCQYHRLKSHDNTFIDTQFDRPPIKIPWKAIGLAVVLFIFGSIFLVLGSLRASGYIDSKTFSGTPWPLIIIGVIMFIPGAYHVHVAYMAFRGYDGYSFEDIPEY